MVEEFNAFFFLLLNSKRRLLVDLALLITPEKVSGTGNTFTLYLEGNIHSTREIRPFLRKLRKKPLEFLSVFLLCDGHMPSNITYLKKWIGERTKMAA